MRIRADEKAQKRALIKFVVDVRVLSLHCDEARRGPGTFGEGSPTYLFRSEVAHVSLTLSLSSLRRNADVQGIAASTPRVASALIEPLEDRRLFSDTYFWISSSPSQVTEGGTAQITFTGSGPGTSITVNYRFTGVAEKGVDKDYTATHDFDGSEATGSIVVAIPDDANTINIQALCDEEIEQDESVVFELLPSPDYEVGYPPEWGMPEGSGVSAEISLKQGALAMDDLLSDNLGAGVTWDLQTKTLTIPRAAPGAQEGTEARLKAKVVSGGKTQKNATLTGQWTALPFEFAAAPRVTPSAPSNGVTTFIFRAGPLADLGTYTYRISYNELVFTDITVKIVEHV